MTEEASAPVNGGSLSPHDEARTPSEATPTPSGSTWRSRRRLKPQSALRKAKSESDKEKDDFFSMRGSVVIPEPTVKDEHQDDVVTQKDENTPKVEHATSTQLSESQTASAEVTIADSSGVEVVELGDETLDSVVVLSDGDDEPVTTAAKSVHSDSEDGYSDLDADMIELIKQKKRELAAQKPFFVQVTLDYKLLDVQGSLNVDIASVSEMKDLKAILSEHLQSQGVAAAAISLVPEGALLFNGVEVLDFSTPVSLSIREQQPEMALSLITREAYQRQQSALLDDDEVGDMESSRGQRTVSLPNPPAAAPMDDYFRVVMRGKDGVTVAVRVNPATPISRLVAYYRTKMNLADTVKIRLEFDEDPLDPDSIVGDTELEEDYTIDVYIETQKTQQTQQTQG